jgi:serine/threonine-protein kinase
VAKHIEEDPPSPRALNADVPESFAALILKAMAKDPARRFASAAEMHDALAGVG